MIRWKKLSDGPPTENGHYFVWITPHAEDPVFKEKYYDVVEYIAHPRNSQEQAYPGWQFDHNKRPTTRILGITHYCKATPPQEEYELRREQESF